MSRYIPTLFTISTSPGVPDFSEATEAAGSQDLRQICEIDFTGILLAALLNGQHIGQTKPRGEGGEEGPTNGRGGERSDRGAKRPILPDLRLRRNLRSREPRRMGTRLSL